MELRILEPHDAPALAQMTNDPRITGMVNFLPETFTTADAEKLIAGDGSGRDHYLGAWLEGMGELAAMIGVHFHDSGETEIGYWVKADLHGRGIASEAAAAAIDMLRTHFPERPIIAECRTANVASWRLLEKLGFHGTGEAGRRPGRERLALI